MDTLPPTQLIHGNRPSVPPKSYQNRALGYLNTNLSLTIHDAGYTVKGRIGAPKCSPVGVWSLVEFQQKTSTGRLKIFPGSSSLTVQPLVVRRIYERASFIHSRRENPIQTCIDRLTLISFPHVAVPCHLALSAGCPDST